MRRKNANVMDVLSLPLFTFAVRRPNGIARASLDVDLQFPVEERAFAELDGLAPPLGLGGVGRGGGGLPPEEAVYQGRRHGQSESQAATAAATAAAV